MRWTSTVSVKTDLAAAVAEATAALRQQLGSCAPQLLLVFVAAEHGAGFDRLATLLKAEFPGALLFGCSGGGVIGGGREIERKPALVLSAAWLPGVRLTPVHLDNDQFPGPGDRAGWEELLQLPGDASGALLLLADPFSCAVEALLRGLDRSFPELTKLGGLASGGAAPGAHALYLGEQVYRSGVVALALTGALSVETVVAQGCRPIGEPLFVTRAERNTIRTLDGRTPVAVLSELHAGLSEQDQALFRYSLFIGLAMRDARSQYRQGDFLIRNILSLDRHSGALDVGAIVPENSVVQFHLRDADTSATDLDLLLRRYAAVSEAERPQGALLWSCLGRGEHLYNRPDHDSAVFRRYLGPLPLTGFFCNGEIGPVQGATYLHGYTSVFALFRSR